MSLAPPLPTPPASRSRYRTVLAGPAEIHAVQRLRYEVFTEELGEPLSPSSAVDRRNADEWDDRCDHLVVEDQSAGEVVGACRLLPPERPSPPAAPRATARSTSAATRRSAHGPWRPVAAVCTRRPAYDRHAGTADLYVPLTLADVDARVLQVLLGAGR